MTGARAAFIAALTAALVSPELSAQNISAREADKAERLKQALVGQLLPLYDTVRAKDRPFCDRMYDAFKTASPRIKYIEPVIATDNPEHPELLKYKSCSSDRPGGVGLDSFGDLSFIGTHAFRLYRFESGVGRDRQTLEYVYGERPTNSHSPSAGYARIDLRDCAYLELKPVVPEKAPDGNGIQGINALIRLGQQHFIYSYTEGQIVMWAHYQGRKNFAQSCVWLREGKPKTEPEELTNQGGSR